MSEGQREPGGTARDAEAGRRLSAHRTRTAFRAFANKLLRNRCDEPFFVEVVTVTGRLEERSTAAVLAASLELLSAKLSAKAVLQVHLFATQDHGEGSCVGAVLQLSSLGVDLTNIHCHCAAPRARAS